MTELAARNRRSAMLAALVALFMVGLGFASVPLYRLFCQVTGFAGTTGRADAADVPWKPAAGTVMVRFDANTAPGLPWRFRPEKTVEQVRIGERLMAFYIAENLTNRPVTGRATYNVSPDQAGGHFQKIQCFCFTEQTLQPGERVRMPVIYFVDPAILKDSDARDVQEITLSYTFYPVDSGEKGSQRRAQDHIRESFMAGAKNHDYHILPPSPWPLIGSFSALVMAAGGIMWMHEAAYGGLVFFLGLAGVLFTMFGWWSDVIKEAHAGDHTPVVSLHLRYGMILFIASEVMFFVGWFWAWFDFALFPAPLEVSEGVATLSETATPSWPPQGLEIIDPFGFPLLNTLILLCSGTTVTWAHHSLIHGDRDGLKKGLWLTIILGLIFSAIQAYEYAHAEIPFKGLNYGAAFYMATGFHGFHVLVGTIFLIVCLARAYKGHFTPRQHFGFEAAAWYWHFVDVVWLFLFISVYVWGSWGAGA